MDLKTFFEEVEKEIEYLSYGSFTFDQYLSLSKRNRRVRNAFVFFALSKQEYIDHFFSLTSQSQYVKELKNDLHKSLIRVKNSGLHRNEVIKISNTLLSIHFNNATVEVDLKVYDVSVEMEKFLVGVVNDHYIFSEATEESRHYVEKMMNKIDFDNLFVDRNDKG